MYPVGLSELLETLSLNALVFTGADENDSISELHDKVGLHDCMTHSAP